MDKAVLSSSLSRALYRHWWAALAAFASVMGASVFYLKVTPSLYQASARVMIDEQAVSVSDLGQALTQLSNNSSSGVNPIATQVELATSERVLKQALNNVFSANEAGPGQVGEADIPTVEAVRHDLNIIIVPATNILQLNYLNSDPELAAAIVNAIADSTVEENARAIRAQASSVRYFLEGKLPEQQARLERAEAAESQYRQANGIVSLDTQTDSLITSLSELENEERTLQAQLQESAERSTLLKQVTGVQALAGAYDAVEVGQDKELNEIRDKLTALETAIIESRSRLGDQHPDLLALLDQQADLNQLYSQKLASILRTSQGDGAASRASGDLSQSLMTDYIKGEIDRQAIEQRLAVVQAERSQLQQRIAKIPLLQQPLATLTRQREEAEETIRLLQGKLEEARIAEAQLVSNIRIIGQADVPTDPAEPSPPLILVLGAITGFLLSAGMILALEALDNTVRDGAELESTLKIPTLGYLPKVPPELVSAGGLEPFLNTPDLVEPYHALLRTLESQHRQPSTSQKAISDQLQALDLRIHSNPLILVISSACVGEGKSTVATLLGAVAGSLSRRTLIIDADLRQPIQSNLFDLTADLGLTEVIQGNNSLLEVIQPSGIENLSVLPRGQLAIRPSVLAESTSMENFLQDAAFLYDLILIDAPPAINTADVVAFSQHADGLLLAVRPDFAPRDGIRKIVNNLQQSGVTILGAVLNEATLPGEEKDLYASQPNLDSQPRSSEIRQLSR